MRKLFAVCCVLSFVAAAALAGPIEDARALIDAGELEAAEKTLVSAADNARLQAAASAMLAEIANRQEDYEKGMEWGKKAIAADDTSSNAHYQYAWALRNKMQKVSKMRAMMSLGDYKRELARAIELDGNNIDARQEQIGFYLNAPGIAGGSDEKARQLAVELRAIDWRAGTIELAEVESEMKNQDAATALYEELVERHPDDVTVRYRLGFRLQTQERWAEADAQFEQAGVHDDETAQSALYQRARTRILGKYDQEQAVAFLKTYLAEIDAGAQPSPSSAWWRIGNAYEQLGRTGDARSAYEQALSLDKGNREAKKSLKALSKR